MNILITGANGFIGQKLTSNLSTCSDYDLRLVSRKPIISSHTNFLIDDISSEIDWNPFLNDIDVVIHLAAHVHHMKKNNSRDLNKFIGVNSHATKNLAVQASLAGVKRFVFLSSVKVHGDRTIPMEPFKADDLEHSSPDSKQCKEFIMKRDYDAYSLSKYMAESNLISICNETGMEYSIIRPPLVYGPNVKGNFEYLLSLLRKELPLPFAGIRNSRSFVFVENLVDLIVKCINKETAANQALLVSDGQDLSTTELINKLVIELKSNVSLFKIPRSGFKLVASMIGKRDIFSRLFENLEVNTEKTFNILNWTPPFSLDDGLAKTVQHYLKNSKS